MRRFFYALASAEFWAAIRVAAFGHWWADHADYRKAKNSGEKSDRGPQ